jgi:hypothetical protein
LVVPGLTYAYLESTLKANLVKEGSVWKHIVSNARQRNR